MKSLVVCPAVWSYNLTMAEVLPGSTERRTFHAFPGTGRGFDQRCHSRVLSPQQRGTRESSRGDVLSNGLHYWVPAYAGTTRRRCTRPSRRGACPPSQPSVDRRTTVEVLQVSSDATDLPRFPRDRARGQVAGTGRGYDRSRHQAQGVPSFAQESDPFSGL